VAIKAEKVLHVYAAGDGGPFIFIKSYPVLGASGRLGPKLREGDRQVPEGIYPIESLNPNSRYHLSLRIGYPGKFDREMARREGRTDLGGDIMIHGGDLSIGCLAVGDEAAEDLFVLAADAGVEKVCAVLAPVDFRKDPDPGTDPPALPTEPAWVADLYAALSGELSRYPPP
jgi:murein L,D-transpeptidase YafK